MEFLFVWSTIFFEAGFIGFGLFIREIIIISIFILLRSSQKLLFSKSVLTRRYLKMGINISLQFYFLEAVIACYKGIKFCFSVEVYLCP